MVSATSSVVILPDRTLPWKLHLETSWSQSQHSSTEHLISIRVYSSHPALIHLIWSQITWKGARKSRLMNRESHSFSILCIMGYHMSEALGASGPFQQLLLGLDDFRQGFSATRRELQPLNKGEDICLSNRTLTVRKRLPNCNVSHRCPTQVAFCSLGILDFLLTTIIPYARGKRETH